MDQQNQKIYGHGSLQQSQDNLSQEMESEEGVAIINQQNQEGLADNISQFILSPQPSFDFFGPNSVLPGNHEPGFIEQEFDQIEMGESQSDHEEGEEFGRPTSDQMESSGQSQAQEYQEQQEYEGIDHMLFGFSQVRINSDTIMRKSQMNWGKNVNCVKKFCQSMAKEYRKYMSYINTLPSNLRRQILRFFRMQAKIHPSKNSNHNLESMRKFFGVIDESEEGRNRSRCMRQLQHMHLTQRLIREIASSSIIKNKKSYMMTYKLMIHRARNAELAVRAQSR